VDQQLLRVVPVGRDGHLQRVLDQALAHVSRQLPTDDHAAVGIDDEAKEHPARLAVRRSIREKGHAVSKLRPSLGDLDQPPQAAKLALRSRVRRIEQLDTEIAELDQQLKVLVARASPRTAQLLGISTGHAGQLLVTAGPEHRPPTRKRRVRRPLRRQPDPRVIRTPPPQLRLRRDANRTLHMIAVCRLRYCARTQAYAARRTKQGQPSARSSAA
jgi:hypothetical protein